MFAGVVAATLLFIASAAINKGAEKGPISVGELSELQAKIYIRREDAKRGINIER